MGSDQDRDLWIDGVGAVPKALGPSLLPLANEALEAWMRQPPNKRMQPAVASGLKETSDSSERRSRRS
jgi:hypothetical protein